MPVTEEHIEKIYYQFRKAQADYSLPIGILCSATTKLHIILDGPREFRLWEYRVSKTEY